MPSESYQWITHRFTGHDMAEATDAFSAWFGYEPPWTITRQPIFRSLEGALMLYLTHAESPDGCTIYVTACMAAPEGSP